MVFIKGVTYSSSPVFSFTRGQVATVYTVFFLFFFFVKKQTNDMVLFLFSFLLHWKLNYLMLFNIIKQSLVLSPSLFFSFTINTRLGPSQKWTSILSCGQASPKMLCNVIWVAQIQHLKYYFSQIWDIVASMHWIMLWSHGTTWYSIIELAMAGRSYGIERNGIFSELPE